MKILAELLDGEYYFDIYLTELDIENLKCKKLICKDIYINEMLMNVSLCLDMEEEEDAIKKGEIQEDDFWEYF